MSQGTAKTFKKALSAGAVVFRETPEHERQYLLLQHEREAEYWGYLKGAVEQGEDPHNTARREIQEEAGLSDIAFVPGFEKRVRYFFRQEGVLIAKEVVYFLCQSLSGKVSISFEHKTFQWFPYDEAIKKVTYNKEVLESAEMYLRIINAEQTPKLF